MQSTANEMTEVRAMEAEVAAQLGHELRCFEIFAETKVELGEAEYGDLNETMADGQPLIRWFERDVRAGRFCECAVTIEEE